MKKLKKIAASIPPAWTDVVMAPADPKYMAKGMHIDKQTGQKIAVTKYTKKYSELRNKNKHCALKEFAKKMEVMEEECRKNVKQAKKNNTITKQTIISVVILLIIQCAFRIGSKKPKGDDGNRGIFYIKDNHVKIEKDKVSIKFTGKWSKINQCQLDDRDVADLLNRFLHSSKEKHKICFSP